MTTRVTTPLSIPRDVMIELCLIADDQREVRTVGMLRVAVRPQSRKACKDSSNTNTRTVTRSIPLSFGGITDIETPC